MFRTVPLSIIRGLSLYTQQWYMPYRFADSLLSANLYGMYHCCVYSEKLSANLYGIYHCCVYSEKLSANLYGIYHCCVYSEKLLMKDRGTVRNI